MIVHSVSLLFLPLVFRLIASAPAGLGRKPALLVALSAALVPSSALAQDSAAAEALFRSAQKAADQGDWVTACDRFQESNRLDPAPGTVLNIARCRERLGQLASAWENYQKAGEVLPAGDRRAQYARSKAKELSPRVPRLTLLPPQMGEEEVEYTVRVQDTDYAEASLGVPLPFDPGKVRVVVQAPGREVFELQLTLEEGDRIERQLEIGSPLEGGSELAPQPETDSPASEESVRRSRVPAIVAYSVGGLGAAAAVGGGVWAAMELPVVNDNCSGGRCNRSGADASARGRTAVIVTGVGAGVALVGVTLGTILWFRSSGASSETARATSQGRAHAPSFAWGVEPRPGGAALNLRSTLRGGKLWF